MSKLTTICGGCGATDAKGYIGTSRKDNKTILCRECEQEEAMKEAICPTCNEYYYEYPAISRKDNKTNICSKCGMVEALNDAKIKEDKMCTCSTHCTNSPYHEESCCDDSKWCYCWCHAQQYKKFRKLINEVKHLIQSEIDNR